MPPPLALKPTHSQKPISVVAVQPPASNPIWSILDSKEREKKTTAASLVYFSQYVYILYVSK